MENGEREDRRFLSGREEDFEECVALYRDGLFFFLYRMVGSEQDAEELAIDAFAELYLRRDRYDGRSSVKTYLYMIARSRALDFLRRKKRRQAYSAPLEDLPELAGAEDRPEKRAEEAIRNRAIACAMRELDPEARLAIYLLYFERMSYGEIAAVMKKNTKQIDNLLQRGKKRLKEYLGEEGRALL
ncbi:MAG: RNA polymerase sigma factor [Clostridia bacterium]|nr:RNA polymerase sigma factor [Clostridia bacterium]